MNRLSCECKSLEEFYCKLWQSDGIIPTDVQVLEIVFRLDTADYVIIFSLPEERKMTDVPYEKRKSMELELIWKTYLRGANRSAYAPYKKIISMQQRFVHGIRDAGFYHHDKKWRGWETLGMKGHSDDCITETVHKEE